MKTSLKYTCIIGLFLSLGFVKSVMGQPLSFENANCQDFFMSIESGELKKVKVCLKIKPSLLNKKDPHGNTPLLVACAHSQVNVAAYLIKNNAFVNQTNQEDFTALHFATKTGNANLVKLLINNNANATLKTNSDDNVLELAAMSSNLALVLWLEKRYPSLINKQKLILSAAKGSGLVVLDHFLNEGVSKALVDKEGNGLLHYAAMGGDLTIFSYLVESHSLNENAMNLEGKTAMDLAIQYGNLPIVKYLLNRGIFNVSNASKTAAWYALAESYGWVHILLFFDGLELNNNMNIRRGALLN